MRINSLISLRVGNASSTRVIGPGASVDMAEGEAKRLIELGFATMSQADVIGEDALVEAIVDAIADLPPDAFGKDGKPNVKAIELVLGQNISAADRDKGWILFQRLATDDSLL
jgi:hypothetical protein